MTASLLTFLFAIIILTLTPGFDTALILRTSAANGWKKPSPPVWGSIPAVWRGAPRWAWD